MSPARLIAWLQRAPATARALQLLFAGLAEPELMDAWEPPFVASDLGRDVLASAQEYCDDEDARCRFYVRWVNEQGECVTQTVIKCKPAGARGYKPGTSQLDGFRDSSRHIEGMARVHLGGMSVAVDTLKEINQELRAENKELRGVIHDLIVYMQAKVTEQTESDVEGTAILKKAGEYVETYILPAVAGAIAERVAPAAAPNGAAPPETEH